MILYLANLIPFFLPLIPLFPPLTQGKVVPANENLQKITFFSNADYSGQRESFYQTNLDIQANSTVGRVAKSFCIEKGVWIIYGNMSYGPGAEPPQENPDFDITNGLLGNSNFGMLCVSLHNEEMNQSALYTVIRHLAGSDMESTSLSLYTEKWKGDEHFVAGDSIRLPTPIPVSSFAFTGNVPWTLTMASGQEFCLPPPEQANDPFLMGLAFAAMVQPVSVSSAVKGCADQRKNVLRVGPELGLLSQNGLQPPPGLVKLGKINVLKE